VRFEELLHWNDGQFLQPHHFQYLQRINAEYIRLNRYFALPYTYGLIDFELDQEALAGSRVVVRRFSAIMPDGLELSGPGNCILKPLDLSSVLKQHPTELTVYVGVPQWSEYEGNMTEEGEALGKKRYLTQKKRQRDENSGDNEITLITRRINARFVTNLDDTRDMQVLPILKLTVVTRDNAEASVTVNEKYLPPFMLFSADSPLFSTAEGLLVDIRRCRDKVLNNLTIAKFKPDNFSGVDAYNVLFLQVLNLYETRLSSLLMAGHCSPFGLYLELSSFLAELMGLNPMNGVREIARYVHDDSGPQFTGLINDIRSFIVAKGGAGYIKLEFSLIDNGLYLFAPLETEDIMRFKELYLAVHTDVEDYEVVKALEHGDTFKLISPQAKSMRTRGIKLTEMRYPPRFLPVLNRTIWFKLELEESARVWREICEGKGVVIDFAHNLFPGLETALFITVLE
jgi:type VI secretion system ImpJ/VasE family protein